METKKLRTISFRKILGHFWPHMRKHPWSFALTFVGFGVAVAISSTILPFYYRGIIDVITRAEVPESVASTLLGIIGLYALTIFVAQVFYRIGDFSIVRFETQVMKRLEDYTFAKLTKHSYDFFINNFAGSLVAKARRFVRSFEAMFDVISFTFWTTTVRLIGVIGALFFVEPVLGWIFFVWSILYLAISFFFAKKRIVYNLDAAEVDSKVTGFLADVIANMANLKMFSSRRREEGSFADLTDQQSYLRKKAWNFQNIIFMVQGLFIMVLEVSAISVAVLFWIRGQSSPGTIVLVQAYAASVFDGVWNLGKAVVRFMKHASDAAEMVDILDTPLDIEDPEHPEQVRISQGEIRFDDVSFTYSGGVNVFEDFSLLIHPGEKVGLVGSSGAGKSTITKLLLRFEDVSKGAVMVDGQNVMHLSQDDLRSRIAYVPQDPVLFHRSLRENIAYSKPGASEEEIVDAAKRAHAHEFIVNLPEGYETLVGERGVKLSGGERQRVAIARAMLKNAPVLVLDEATSSLDAESELHIQEALAELMEGKTTIVIAHRLSTVRRMDRILVLEGGEVIEEGTHDELVARGGRYKTLWDHQVGGII